MTVRYMIRGKTMINMCNITTGTCNYFQNKPIDFVCTCVISSKASGILHPSWQDSGSGGIKFGSWGIGKPQKTSSSRSWQRHGWSYEKSYRWNQNWPCSSSKEIQYFLRLVKSNAVAYSFRSCSCKMTSFSNGCWIKCLLTEQDFDATEKNIISALCAWCTKPCLSYF